MGSAVGVAANALIIKMQFRRVANELVILFSATVQTIIYSLVVPVFAGLDGVRAALARPDIVVLVALGAVAIFGNLFLYYYAMKRAPMWAVRILVLTGPPVAMIADHFLLNSPITAAGVQGLVAVLIGATMVIMSERRATTGPGEATDATDDESRTHAVFTPKVTEGRR